MEAANEYFAEFTEKAGKGLKERSDKGAEFWIKSLDDWQQAKAKLQEFLPRVLEGWKKKTHLKEDQENQEATEQEAEMSDTIPGSAH